MHHTGAIPVLCAASSSPESPRVQAPFSYQRESLLCLCTPCLAIPGGRHSPGLKFYHVRPTPVPFLILTTPQSLTFDLSCAGSGVSQELIY